MLYTFMEELQQHRSSTLQASVQKPTIVNTGNSIKMPTSQSLNRQDNNTVVTLNNNPMSDKKSERNTSFKENPHLKERSTSNNVKQHKPSSGYSNSGMFGGAFGSDQMQFLKSPRMMHAQTSSNAHEAMLQVENLVLPTSQQLPGPHKSPVPQVVIKDLHSQPDHDKNTMSKALESIDISQTQELNRSRATRQKNTSNITMPADVKASIRTDQGLGLRELANNLVTSRDNLKKNQANSNEGRKTTILSKSQNGEILLNSSMHGIRFNKESDEYNYPKTIQNTNNDLTLDKTHFIR